MTKKDYVLLAQTIKTTMNNSLLLSEDAQWLAKQITADLCSALKQDNPRFDTQHFVEVITGQRGLTSRPSKKTVKL